jgi:arylsulfatase A-like enzyme
MPVVRPLTDVPQYRSTCNFRRAPVLMTLLLLRAALPPSRSAAMLWLPALVYALLLLPGCTPQPTLGPPLMSTEPIPPGALVVPGRQPWADTGIDIVAGQPLTITAKGRVRIGKIKKPKDDAEFEVGPQGTFFYGDDMQGQPFPLPAAGSGPASCFSLIGRIGHGPVFFVGEARSWVPEQTGRLYLGINDFDPAGNSGEFYAEVIKPREVHPVSYRQEVPYDAAESTPSTQGCVVVFYVDGLRPDVVEEMAAMHHLPNIRRIFIDGGTHLRNAFTAFPSDTITSNGTMWTGCFSDRHGLKGQVRFSRRRLRSDSFLEPLGPNRSSRHLQPQGLDKVVHETESLAIGAVAGAEEERQFRASQTSTTPAIYDYLRANGQDWATGVLPVMTDMPPVLWTRSMARFLPYFQAQQAWKYIDDANSHYAVRHLLRQYRPVTIIWLPETDSVSHKECRGQFGSTRRTIALADRLLGEVVSELEAQGRLNQTYFVLVSDHGHNGGRDMHLARFDLANEFLYASREVTQDGRWVGGGLGLSVKQHRYANWHKGDGLKQFAFIDGDSDGAARIFLPRGQYSSGDWSGPNCPADLLAYRIAPKQAPINLPLTLASATAVHDNGEVQHPIDLVLMKLTDDSILITTCDRGQAVVERRRNEQGNWVYRYTPVKDFCRTACGDVTFEPILDPQIDPLGILPRVRRGFLQNFHDEQTWLWVTAGSDYPDGVVTLTRHLMWQENIMPQEMEYAPDLVVTARRGWLFGTQNTPGTTHGYPLAESVRATWYISGPCIRQGARVDAPCRLVDLTPTILSLTGTPHDPAQFDGRALRNIFRTEPRGEPGIEKVSHRPPPESRVVERPVYWRDVDLQAWQPLRYTPADTFQDVPWTINNPNSGWDLNNLAYNALTIGDWSVFRLVDDVLSPLTPGRTKVNQTVEKADRRIAHSRRPWLGEGVQALNIPGVSLADYSPTSTGNLKRMDGAVDWLQERGTRLDGKLATKTNHRTVLGAPIANALIDGVQYSFWEVYRFAQRIIAEVLDETILNGVENGVDATINTFRSTPAEIIVDDPRGR